MMEDIKKLRTSTGAGMVECKKALEEANNDIDKAIDILRKKGIAKAAKRADREANEGIIKTKISPDAKKVFILELNSETDFVARNEKFQEFAQEVLDLAVKEDVNDLEKLLNLKLNSLSVKEALDNLSGTIGEKLIINKIDSISGQSVAAYSHMGGKIASIVALDQEAKEDLALELAMQIVATNPKYIKSDQVNPEELEKEKNIYREQLLKEGKPEQIIEKILVGKIEKYYSEVCLLNQEYIKEEKKTIKDILAGANILGFIRYSLE
jgi:elongation factor Ts